jgi:hypothetical protein
MAIVASVFGNLASNQNLQALIDNSIDVFQTDSIWRNYLDWGVPKIELTFATAIGRSRIQAAASIVDPDSPAPLRGRSSLELLEGKIPTMKQAFSMNQQDYRALLMLNNLPIADGQKKTQLIEKLFNDVKLASVSTDRRLDIMFLQAVSNFSIDLSITLNPDGAALGTVDLLAKTDQKRTVTTTWISGNAATADPFADMEAVVNYAALSGRSFSEVWIDQSLWLTIKTFDKVKSAIAGYQNPGSNKNFIVTLDRVNEYLAANKQPILKVMNERRGIEKDGKITTVNPFNSNNVVFVPAGKLGVVHNAICVEEVEPVAGVNYAKYDRTLLSKFRDNNPWMEYTQVELNAFPALEAIDGIFILQSNVAS